MNNQVNEVLEKIREVCEDKSNWSKPTHGTCCTCQRCGGDIDWCHCLGLSDIELNHLLLVLGETQGVYDGYFLHANGWLMWEKTEGGHTETKQLHRIDLQKSVEDNLRSNPELLKWVHGVIIGKE